MIRWRDGTVARVRRRWAGAVEVDVTIDRPSAADAAAGAGEVVRALAYPTLTGEPVPGDRVLLNTTALHLGLGTGGYALVVALPDRLPPDPADTSDPAGSAATPGHPAADRPQGGHLVKARYTPLQATVPGVDEQGSPHHAALRDADDIGGMPVVVADLHSALPAVLAGLYADEAEHAPGDGTCPGIGAGAERIRTVYVMTDGGALPAWFSRTGAALREAGWLAATVTVGQAFGGDLEAVTLHSGLLAARHVLGADVAVVAQGPGNLGTGTRWGFSGVAAGEAVNAVAALHGRPVASVRVSGAEPRQRHRGLSHHSLTAYGRVALAAADVVLPVLPDLLAALGHEVIRAAQPLAARHSLVQVPVDGLDAALRRCPAPLSTMGRNLDEDPAYFLAAAAAGRHAARLLGG